MWNDCCGLHNYPMAEVKWIESQSNSDTLTVMLLSEKSCVLTNIYNF